MPVREEFLSDRFLASQRIETGPATRADKKGNPVFLVGYLPSAATIALF